MSSISKIKNTSAIKKYCKENGVRLGNLGVNPHSKGPCFWASALRRLVLIPATAAKTSLASLSIENLATKITTILIQWELLFHESGLKPQDRLTLNTPLTQRQENILRYLEEEGLGQVKA